MSHDLLPLILEGSLETLYMVGFSSTVAALVGLPMGVVLSVTAAGCILENKLLNATLSFFVNIGRSVPFIILMVAIIPLTRVIAGTSIGTNAAVVPLSVAAIPFVARVVESALREIDQGIVEAALSMGATPLQIIYKVLLPEALPAIVAGLTLTLINLISS